MVYTDKINRPPDSNVRIEGPIGTARNRPMQFIGHASDPDGDPLTFAWARSEGACPAAPTLAAMPPATGSSDSFEVTVATLDPFCVWLAVTDDSGAAAAVPAVLDAHAANSAPTAQLTRQQPGGNDLAAFPLYSDFRFSAAVSTDPDHDALTRTWSLAAFPDTSNAQLVACAPTAPTDLAMCFHADVPGAYALTLTVSDGVATSAIAATTVTVADDAPPCLIGEGADLPARVSGTDESQTFSVTVADDGDPWPPADPSYAAPGKPTFAWRLRRDGGAWSDVTGYDLSSLTIAGGDLTIGETLDVRVEVADRLTRSLAACGDAPTCALAMGCAQRLTWTVRYQ